MRVLKVLVAYEGRQSVYAEAFGAIIRESMSSAKVRIVDTRELGREVSTFSPHLVVSDEPTDVFPEVGAWFMLSAEPDEPSEMRLGARHWFCSNPGLGALGKVVEAVGGLVHEGRYVDAI